MSNEELNVSRGEDEDPLKALKKPLDARFDEVLKDAVVHIDNNLDRFSKKYRSIAKFELPDNLTKAIVYKRIN